MGRSMAENTKSKAGQTSSFDPTLQSEKVSFDPEELVQCAGCGRMNPPNRSKCIYCAGQLDAELKAPDSGKMTFRPLELWEKGFNLISVSGSENAGIHRIARLLSIEQEDLRAALNARVPLPVARVETPKEASFLRESLETQGLKCLMIRDEDLAADILPTRVRGIPFRDHEVVFIDFNTGAATAVPIEELSVIVAGTLMTGRLDSVEKRARGGKRKLMDETATSFDQPVLDIYRRRDPTGFRVNQSGFDFSCLGKDKGLLAGENMRRLAARLKHHAPAIRVVNDYALVRHLLDKTWELESRTDPQGQQRSGLGRVGYGTVATTNNINQFTKYSRLQWQLYGKQ